MFWKHRKVSMIELAHYPSVLCVCLESILMSILRPGEGPSATMQFPIGVSKAPLVLLLLRARATRRPPRRRALRRTQAQAVEHHVPAGVRGTRRVHARAASRAFAPSSCQSGHRAPRAPAATRGRQRTRVTVTSQLGRPAASRRPTAPRFKGSRPFSLFKNER